MKWKNLDLGAGCYFITGTVTEWMPLLERPSIREVVCEAIEAALTRCEASLLAYVFMPDHLHFVVYLPDGGLLHRFNRLWRGQSAWRCLQVLQCEGDKTTLAVLAEHAHSGGKYAFWKEQVRALALEGELKLEQKLAYIHANPIRRGLVDTEEEWPWSSFGFYSTDEPGLLPVDPSLLL